MQPSSDPSKRRPPRIQSMPSIASAASQYQNNSESRISLFSIPTVSSSQQNTHSRHILPPSPMGRQTSTALSIAQLDSPSTRQQHPQESMIHNLEKTSENPQECLRLYANHITKSNRARDKELMDLKKQIAALQLHVDGIHSQLANFCTKVQQDNLQCVALLHALSASIHSPTTPTAPIVFPIQEHEEER